MAPMEPLGRAQPARACGGRTSALGHAPAGSIASGAGSVVDAHQSSRGSSMGKLVTVLVGAVAVAGGTAAPACAEVSGNWAGWVDVIHKGYAFDGVRAFFRVPSVNVDKTTNGKGGNQAVFWVGLGGYVKGDPLILIQAGIGETANRRTGSAEYWSWWEVEPSPGDARFPGTYQRRFPKDPKVLIRGPSRRDLESVRRHPTRRQLRRAQGQRR